MRREYTECTLLATGQDVDGHLRFLNRRSTDAHHISPSAMLNSISRTKSVLVQAGALYCFCRAACVARSSACMAVDAVVFVRYNSPSLPHWGHSQEAMRPRGSKVKIPPPLACRLRSRR